MDSTLIFASNLAREAGYFLLDRFKPAGTSVNVKADRSVVTETDLATDRLIANSIHDHYPGDGIISEEIAFKSSSLSEVTWVIDPLDGTSNFSLGLPFWGVSIARLVNGWPETAALYFPFIQEFYTAQKGQGAFLNDEPIRAGYQEGHAYPFFACCSRTFRRYHVSVPFKPRILGSAAYDLCSLARGISILVFEAAPKIWDIAAAWLMVEEAGGIIEVMGDPEPFPLKANTDYSKLNLPTLAAATPALAAQGRQQIRPKEAGETKTGPLDPRLQE